MGQLTARLKSIRARTGRTRRYVSRASGVGESTAKNWEENKNTPNPTIRAIKRYVEECGSSIGELFAPWLGDDEELADEYYIREIRRVLRDKNGRRWLLMFLEMYDETRSKPRSARQ